MITARRAPGAVPRQAIRPRQVERLVILISMGAMSMKNLFDATVANQVKARLGKLEPETERHWGKMTPRRCSRIAR